MAHKPKRYVILEKAPWPYETVKELNLSQTKTEGKTEYMCPSHGDKEVKLRATISGWECPENNCGYKQDYYYGEELIC